MADIVRLEENGVVKFVQTHVEAVTGLDVKLAKSNKVFYSGAAFLTENQSYAIDLTEIKESLIIVFSRYNKSTGAAESWGKISYSVTKVDIIKNAGNHREFAVYGSGIWAAKQVYISTNKITGHAQNKDSNGDLWVLTQLIAN